MPIYTLKLLFLSRSDRLFVAKGPGPKGPGPKGPGPKGPGMGGPKMPPPMPGANNNYSNSPPIPKGPKGQM